MDQKPKALRRALERNEQMPAVSSDLRKGKALAWLIEHVEVVDEEGNPVDRGVLGQAVIDDHDDHDHEHHDHEHHDHEDHEHEREEVVE